MHGAPARLLCSILPPRGRTAERRRQPPAKVKAAKEGSVSSIRSAQSADCCCNPSALGLPHCPASVLEATTQAGPHSPCLHGAASPRPPGRRGEKEAADARNLPELFLAPPLCNACYYKRLLCILGTWTLRESTLENNLKFRNQTQHPLVSSES